MQKCKSNIVWKFGPLKVYGEHFYLIEEIHSIVAAIVTFPQFILVKRCQTCGERSDIVNVTDEDLKKLVVDFPMAFNKYTLQALKYARAASL